MPEYQPVNPTGISIIERPRCPSCDKSRMTLSMIETGSADFDLRTFECQKCGNVRTLIISSDPMESNTQDWLEGELKPPR